MAQVLRRLPRPADPNLLVGAESFDDAGVYRLDDATAVVVTVDFFPPLVDDAFVFGQIAAANSLSDIYAMGGRPLCALNIVGFPDEKLPQEILGEILRGGAERATAAVAVIAGGHSVRDAEIKYGLAVTGVIHPDRILTNGRAGAGDVLVLTKPIGSGVLTSAYKAGKIDEAELAEAVEVMIDLNAGASRAALEVEAHAVTDVTGFGLVGHAFEMAEASELTIELESARVPLLEQTVALAKKKMLTRAYQSTLEYLDDRFTSEGVDSTLVNVLADAQTSGGLLIAVGPERVDRLVELLNQNQTRSAVPIGRFVQRRDASIVLR